MNKVKKQVSILLLLLMQISAYSFGQDQKVIYIDNGDIRLGIDLNIGGAITYLADSKEKINVINSHDWGRQVQLSFYSGPNPFEPDGKKPSKNWSQLGWNPIQSGDCYGFRSKVIDHRNDGRSLYVKCIPMHWPLRNQPGQNTFECWFTLEGRAVKARCRLNNTRDDKTQYDGRSQELPAVYTNGPYHKLMTYKGDRPFTGDELSEIPKQNHPPGGIKWANWQATENWAALVNDDNWGLGVWNEGIYNFIGGFAGKPGKGGPKDGPTGYIAPLHREILDHNIQYEFKYTLILDNLENIREYIYENSQKQHLPDYVFNGTRNHWVYRNGNDTGWPVDNYLNIISESNRFQLISPDLFWQAAKGQKIKIKAAVKAGIDGPVKGKIYWKTHKDHRFSAERSGNIEFTNDEKFSSYLFDPGVFKGYEGCITGLRIDPMINCPKGGNVKIRSISIVQEQHD